MSEHYKVVYTRTDEQKRYLGTLGTRVSDIGGYITLEMRDGAKVAWRSYQLVKISLDDLVDEIRKENEVINEQQLAKLRTTLHRLFSKQGYCPYCHRSLT